MLLRWVQIDNFRAIRRATLTFDATSVLIGENDCGRSSVMEAVALALGWNAGDGEFLFRPFHIHHPAGRQDCPAPVIAIELEFGESAPGEWNGAGFDLLRSALPAAVTGDRRFRLRVTHGAESPTRWMFRSHGDMPRLDDRALLAWLRGRMPVFWMSEGVVALRQPEGNAREWADESSRRLAGEVSRHYRDLLEGDALDVPAAIAGGSAAAMRLLLAEAKLLPDHSTPLTEVLEEITGKRKPLSSRRSFESSGAPGSAARNIGMLLLVGAALRSGGARRERGVCPLTLIENPEAHLHPMTLASIWNVIDRIGGQKIIATHSGAVVANARLGSVSRLTRSAGSVRQWRVPDGVLSADELRRYSYHLRSRRADAGFARCWLLVEGESEFWMMGELARACGYEFDSEGIACVEFAQCGLSALIKVAHCFGIEWHVLADGDEAGHHYARTAREFSADGVEERITVLREVDIEHCFWSHGYEDVFRKAAYPAAGAASSAARRGVPPKSVIRRAIDRHSKPHLAVLLLDAVIDRGRDGVPPVLRRVIQTCIRLARRAPAMEAAAAAR